MEEKEELLETTIHTVYEDEVEIIFENKHGDTLTLNKERDWVVVDFLIH